MGGGRSWGTNLLVASLNIQPSSTRLLNPKGQKRGEDEARSAEGHDVEAVNLWEELHRTTDDDGD